MFKQVLSSFGLHGVQVDTILNTPHLEVGQNLQGSIHFKGASSTKKNQWDFFRTHDVGGSRKRRT